MLKLLRNKKTAKKIWVVLAAIIIPAFVFWGAGSIGREKKYPRQKFRLFGRDVPEAKFKESLGAVRAQMLLRFGDNFSSLQKFMNLEQQALDRLMLLEEARRQGIKVSDKEVIEEIEAGPLFQGAGGFNQRIYQQVLRYTLRTQPRLFEEETRQNLTIAKLYKKVTQDVKATEEEAKEEFARQNQEINIDYIAAIPAEFAKGIAPDEAALKDYFAKNSLQFKEPLSFNIEYLTLATEDKLKDALLRLRRKDDLKEIAKGMGLSLKESGEFKQSEPIPGIGWSEEAAILVGKLKPGEVSAPVSLDGYYHIIRMKERKEPRIPDFAQIKDKVKNAYIKEESERAARARLETCLNKLRENPRATDMPKLAGEFGLKYGSAEKVKSAGYIEGLGASDKFWAAGQKLKEGDFTPLIAVPSGFYVARLKEKTALDEKRFAAEKETLGQALLARKKDEQFAKFVEDLRIKAR
jgi:peptidyl-prolyl cis-trans isomerase D